MDEHYWAISGSFQMLPWGVLSNVHKTTLLLSRCFTENRATNSHTSAPLDSLRLTSNVTYIFSQAYSPFPSTSANGLALQHAFNK